MRGQLEEEQLEKEIRQYVSSLQSLFEKTNKEKWKPIFLGLLSMTSMLLFVFSILGIVPAAIEQSNGAFFSKQVYFCIKKISPNLISDTKYYFYIFWVILSMFFLLLYKFFIRLSEKHESIQLSRQKLSLCYLYKAIEYLENFLTNKDKYFAINSCKNLKEYWHLSNYKNFTLKNKARETYIRSQEIVKEIEKRFSWFEVNNMNKEVLQAYEDFEDKIIKRIDYYIDIDDTIECLKLLLKSHYCEIDKLRNKTNSKYSQYINEYVYLFSQKTNSLASITIEESAKVKLGLFQKIKSLVESDNDLIKFFVWFIVIFFISTPLLFLLKLSYNISADSQFIVGVIATPIAAAVAMVRFSLFSSKKNNSNPK